ncbi:MAG: ATP synthase F1 subunit delta [Peptoniphilus sp.]|nr:ATP synthase F1 subunit delta [Peptoniphilus sp.]MDD7363220.1 ATP synthase F1 subunit delta [Bacillota bacterium]MDY6044456.1 ATP synthase F1 subunit delta [Peptoniphilus sp.]
MFDEAITKYSVALYEVALERDDLMLDSVEAVRSAYESGDLMAALMHPRIDAEKKHRIIENLFAKDIPDILLNFLFVCVDNKRSNLVVDILNAYEDLCYEGKNIERILVLTPFELTDEKLQAIGRAYRGDKGGDVEMKQKIDKSLIGGVKLVTEHGVIDRSIHRQLDDLKRILKHNA